jgi:hypothetical protein
LIASTNETLIGILGKLDTFKDFEHFNVKNSHFKVIHLTQKLKHSMEGTNMQFEA